MIQQLAHNISYLDQSSKAMIVDFKNKDYSRNQDSFREAAKTKFFLVARPLRGAGGGGEDRPTKKKYLFLKLISGSKKKLDGH